MPLRFDEVGPWTEVKLEIISEYAKFFAKLVSTRSYMKPVYIDGFAGPGRHVSETSGEIIAGTPLKIVDVTPPFREYHFVDADPTKIEELRRQIGKRPGVQLYEGDCNEKLLTEVFPKMTYRSYRKGLCFLDPYGLHVGWEVFEAAGRSRAIDLLLNFPIYDININVLKKDPRKVSAGHKARMTGFWGDDSWRQKLYRPGLFAELEYKATNDEVVAAFAERLKEKAGFDHVSQAIPMKNSKGSTIYYLIGASQKEVAVKVINAVFSKHMRRGGT
jgi:three-Cys-motif partner protein